MRTTQLTDRFVDSTAVSSDEELALGVQQGSQQDLSDLITRYHAPLLGLLHRLSGGNRPLAEDLVQETFLRAMTAIEQYQYPRPFKPWLYTIATNLMRDYFKQADTRLTDSAPDDRFDYTSSQIPAPVETVQTSDDTQQIGTALYQLPLLQREAIILRYYQDLSLKEISDVLNIPVGTVKSRLSIGLKRLHSLVKEKI